MTTAEIYELEAKWKALTSEGWFSQLQSGQTDQHMYSHEIVDDKGEYVAGTLERVVSDFIAAAHNAMPQLIQAAREAESLRAENLELRSQLSTLTKSP